MPDQRANNISLFFWNENGTDASTAVKNEILVQKGESFPVKLVPIDKNSFNEEEIIEIVAQTTMIIAVLTENCLLQSNFVRALEVAVLNKSKIMLLHDLASCRFPGESEQPKSLLMAGVFKDKAVTFMASYVENVAEQILKKYQRYLDSKKTHDFLVLVRTNEEKFVNWAPTAREVQDLKYYLPGVTMKLHPICQGFLEPKDVTTPLESDAQSHIFREPTQEEKAKIDELVRTCHAVVYVPQGRSSPKLATVSRAELYLYEQAMKHNTRVYIMDQHGVYAPLISQFCQRYKLDANLFLGYVQTILPNFGFGSSIIIKEKKLGGCLSLATSTRAFLSHKRSSGQGIAGRIWEGLKDDYSIFLDSEADFDLHDLEVIVERTENFILLLTEGILDSYWCLQEIRSAMRNNKKFIIVRDYSFNLPKLEHFPAELQDVGKKIYESKTLVYMAEFYLPFLVELKKELGIADTPRMLSEIQLGCSKNANATFLPLLKSGKHPLPLKIAVSPDPTIQELKNIDMLKYLQWLGYDLKDVESLSRYVPQDLDEAMWIGNNCPNLKERLELSTMISDIELMKLFDGKRFQKLERISLGDGRQPIALASSLGLSVVVKNLPNLKHLLVSKPARNDPNWYDWLADAHSLETLHCCDPNYKPEVGKNAPPNAKITVSQS